MDWEKVTENGQITTPEAIRKAQEAFAEAAETMGVESEEDIQESVDEVRYGSADPFYSSDNMAELKHRASDAGSGHNMREHDLIDKD